MSRPLTADELRELADSLFTHSAFTELAVALACLGLAWLVVRLLRGTQAKPASVLFGQVVIDGVPHYSCHMLAFYLKHVGGCVCLPQEEF